LKRNAEVRSPKVVRRQSEMFGSATPVTFSSNPQLGGVVEVVTAHPAAAVHGDITMHGTRKPPPIHRPLPWVPPGEVLGSMVPVIHIIRFGQVGPSTEQK
jgi:hypothetical protein